MTKTELIKKLSDDCGLTLKEAETAINTFIDCIIRALANDEKVELRGFGSFRTKQRPARQGRNPKTGDSVSIPPKSVAFFRPGKTFRALIDVQPKPAPRKGRQATAKSAAPPSHRRG